MVEAEATDNAWELIKGQGAVAPSEELVAEGLEASKPFIKALCDAQADLAARNRKPELDLPRFGGFGDDAAQAVEEFAGERMAQVYSIAGKQEREAATDELHQSTLAELTGEGKPFEGRADEVNGAYQALTKQTAVSYTHLDVYKRQRQRRGRVDQPDARADQEHGPALQLQGVQLCASHLLGDRAAGRGLSLIHI